MSDLQPLFRRFHQKIHLAWDDQGARLRERRDRVLNHLRARLKEQRLTFEMFNQGSYEMGTGIKPLSGGQYDIDVGVVFTLQGHEITPLTVKGWVHDALQGPWSVVWRRRCITVNGDGYHLDLPILKREGEKHFLAVGKQNGVAQQRWQPDDQRGFVRLVRQHLVGEGHDEDNYQFRRVIQYLKRWKDVQPFPRPGDAAPTGIAVTVAALKWFRPRRSGGDYSDLEALRTLLADLMRNFPEGGKLVLRFPVEPYDDLLEPMSAEQMKQLRERLVRLQGWLDEAARTGQTAPLVRAFGSDFPPR